MHPLCSGTIVGWAMADHMKASLTTDVLNLAITQGKPHRNLLHHSDRGLQYACDDYQNLLSDHGIPPSMSARAGCGDNAPTESFWGSLKTELVNDQRLKIRDQTKQAIFECIEVFYNRQRLQRAIGYQSPEAFEAGQNEFLLPRPHFGEGHGSIMTPFTRERRF